MTKTNMTIKQEGTTFTAYEDTKILAKGFPELDMALHGIWVLKGHVKTHMYHNKDGVIYLEERKDEL